MNIIEKAGQICRQQGLQPPTPKNYIEFLENRSVVVNNNDSRTTYLAQTKKVLSFQHNDSAMFPSSPSLHLNLLSISSTGPSPRLLLVAPSLMDSDKSVTLVRDVTTSVQVHVEPTLRAPTRELRDRCIECGRPSNCICEESDNRVIEFKSYKDSLKLPALKRFPKGPK